MEPLRLRYSYYTAGSGGVGPTILETSMLLAGEEVVAFRDGQKARRHTRMQPSARGGAALQTPQVWTVRRSRPFASDSWQARRLARAMHGRSSLAAARGAQLPPLGSCGGCRASVHDRGP